MIILGVKEHKRRSATFEEHISFDVLDEIDCQYFLQKFAKKTNFYDEIAYRGFAAS